MLRVLAPLLLVAGARGFASTPSTDTSALEEEIAALKAELAAKEAATNVHGLIGERQWAARGTTPDIAVPPKA